MAEVKLVLVPGHKPIRILKWLVKKGDWIKHGTSLAIYRPVEDPSKPSKAKEIHLKSKHVGTLKMFLLQEGQVAIPGGILLEIDGCSHPVVMKDLCAECGQDLRASGEHSSKKKHGVTHSASVSMIPSIPELRISAQQAEEIAEQDKNRLLKMRKLVLLVDLDQTLIHTTQDPGLAALCQSNEDFYTFQLSKNDPTLYTKLRPHCRDFLKEVSKCYELQIVTFGSRQYAHKIADFIDQEKKHFAHRILSRDECIHPFKKSGNLKHLFPCGDSMVCIIDDRDDVWNAVPNLIVVKKYTYFQGTEDINNPYKRDKATGPPKSEPVSVSVSQSRRKRECENDGPCDEITQSTTKRCRIEAVDSDKHENIDSDSGKNGIDSMEVDVENTVTVTKTNGNAQKTEQVQEESENGIKKRVSMDEDLTLSSDSDSDSNSSTSSGSSSKSSNSSTNSEPATQKGESETLYTNEAIEAETNGAINQVSQSNVSSSEADLKTVECNNNDKIKEGLEIHKCDPDVVSQETARSQKSTNEQTFSSQDTCPASSQSSQSDKPGPITKMERESTGFSMGNNEFAVSSQSSQESEVNTKQKFRDKDDYLPYLQDILLQIHSTYYEAYDKYLKKEFENLPDVRGVVPFLRSKVLYGCCIVLTGIIPHNFRLPPQHHKAFIVARQLGAEVSEQITDKTTHLIAGKKGTAKYQDVKKRDKQDIKVVSVDWLWCCSERWERVSEDLFPVQEKMVSGPSSREGTPPITQQKQEAKSSELGNTYDPVTGKLMRKVRDARFNFMVAEEIRRREEKVKKPVVYSSLMIPDAVVPVIPQQSENPRKIKPQTESSSRHLALGKRSTVPGATGSSVPIATMRSRKRSMVEMVGIEYSLSTDDIADMDKEVNDLLESSDEEEDDDALGTIIENPSSSAITPDDLEAQDTQANDDDDGEEEKESGDEADEMAALLNAEMHYTDDDDDDDNLDAVD